MLPINYINRYAKKMLVEYRTNSGYEFMRKEYGLENLTLSFVRDKLAQDFYFNSWDELLKTTSTHKQFIKLVLSHLYIHEKGVFDKIDKPDWNIESWNRHICLTISHYAALYQGVMRLSETINELLKPIQSINYKTDQNELYNAIAPDISQYLSPYDELDTGVVMLAMLMSGFRMVKRGHKVYFNVSQKRINTIKQIHERNKYLFDNNADYMVYDRINPNGALHIAM